MSKDLLGDYGNLGSRVRRLYAWVNRFGESSRGVKTHCVGTAYIISYCGASSKIDVCFAVGGRGVRSFGDAYPVNLYINGSRGFASCAYVLMGGQGYCVVPSQQPSGLHVRRRFERGSLLKYGTLRIKGPPAFCSKNSTAARTPTRTHKNACCAHAWRLADGGAKGTRGRSAFLVRHKQSAFWTSIVPYVSQP